MGLTQILQPIIFDLDELYLHPSLETLDLCRHRGGSKDLDKRLPLTAEDEIFLILVRAAEVGLIRLLPQMWMVIYVGNENRDDIFDLLGDGEARLYASCPGFPL